MTPLIWSVTRIETRLDMMEGPFKERIDATNDERSARISGMEKNMKTRLNNQEKMVDTLTKLVIEIRDREISRPRNAGYSTVANE